MAGLLDPRQGDGSYVENRPSKWAQTWGILEPYVMGPVNAWEGLRNADLNTLLYDTGPAGRQAAQNAFDVSSTFTGASSVVPKPEDALNMGFRVFHGSPHDFDRFSLDKIGTGEGAQAYGHGLYFAENEGIARSYRDALSSNKFSYKNVRPDEEAVQKFSGLLSDIQQRKAGMADEDGFISLSASADDLSALASEEDKVRNMMVMDTINRNPHLQYGRMYEVEIDADPEQFLDWDKPLSEQPEAVRRLAGWTPEAEAQYRSAQSSDTDALLAALEGDAQYSPAKMPRPPEAIVPFSASGDELHQRMFHQARRELSGEGGARVYQARVAEKLREAGIPGIKYLDAGSRAAGEGSRNYVVFDDNLINIIRKYGIAGLLGGSAAMDAMMSEQQNTQ